MQCDHCHLPINIKVPPGISGRFLHSKCYTEQKQNEANIRRGVLGVRAMRSSGGGKAKVKVNGVESEVERPQSGSNGLRMLGGEKCDV